MRKFFLILLTLTLSACNLPAAAPPPTSTPVSAPSTTSLPPASTPTSEPSPTPMPLTFTPADPDNVVLDFTEQVCFAEWSNNTIHLPCPGDPQDSGSGYVTIMEEVILQDGTRVSAPTLLTIPANANYQYGIFGTYPTLTVYPDDHFKAVLACQEGPIGCDVEYSLHYIDHNNNFRQLARETGPVPLTSHDSLQPGYTMVDIDLSALAGQSVRFVLTVRDHGGYQAFPALWIGAHIQRDPEASPVAVPVFVPTSTSTDTESKIPGVIKGVVDMSSAPPYLNDPVAGSSPVAVMFFNLADGTWWWIHSTITHPNYQMTVPPGEYHVVAFGRGVADVPYVTAGYTGANPSCGQPLQVVTVPPNSMIENIVIADWNWTCGGNAYRPDKPAEVPLP